MKAMVFKIHHEGTAGRAQLVRKVLSGIEVFGGLVLNQTVGGLNPLAVETAIGYGAKIIWGPTVHALNHMKHYGGEDYGVMFKLQKKRPRTTPIEGISIPTEGEFPPNLADILGLIADADIALATTHFTFPEIKRLVTEAKKMGVKKIIVNHPLQDVPDLTLEQIIELAEMGCYIEFVYATLSAMAAMTVTIDEAAECIRKVGPEHCIIGSDCGQTSNPTHAEGIRIYIQLLLERDFSEGEIETMVSKNPSKILSI